MAHPTSDLYRRMVRGGLTYWFTADATLAGTPVTGATGLRPSGGRITDTTAAGVRRVLNLDLPPAPGLFDLLAPTGTRLTVTASVRATDRAITNIPMGVFVVDSQRLADGGGGLSLTAPDKWSLIQRARFLQPETSVQGSAVTTQITTLIRGALGPTEPVQVLTASTASTPALVWEKDRDKAINDLAEGIGAWVYFDRTGLATIAPAPTLGVSADWLIDASTGGILTALDRQRSRADTRNVVVIESSASGGASFPVQIVWDDDPLSPTYAGTNPLTNPGSAGGFGIATYYWDTPLPLTAAQARDAGRSILRRVSGLASQVSLGAGPNPALDAGDVLDVLPLRERYDIPRAVERHIADTVTHPLGTGEQQIDGRSTRIADIVGGS